MKSIREFAGDLAIGRATSVKLVEQALDRIEAYRQAGGAALVPVPSRQSPVPESPVV